MRDAGVAGYIDALMVKTADNLPFTAGTVNCFVQRRSDSKYLKADGTWAAGEPAGADVPTMTHYKSGVWRLLHTPAAADDDYTISALDAGGTCYPDGWTEAVRLPVESRVMEGSYTVKSVMRFILALATGRRTGGGTDTARFANAGNTKSRIIMQQDANGNTTSVTLDDTD